MSDNDLRQEIEKLTSSCAEQGFENARRFFIEHRRAVLEIAEKARAEPKKRDLPSPFVYSMQ